MCVPGWLVRDLACLIVIGYMDKACAEWERIVCYVMLAASVSFSVPIWLDTIGKYLFIPLWYYRKVFVLFRLIPL